MPERLHVQKRHSMFCAVDGKEKTAILHTLSNGDRHFYLLDFTAVSVSYLHLNY